MSTKKPRTKGILMRHRRAVLKFFEQFLDSAKRYDASRGQ
jgi:hypothetical protein